LLACSFNPPSNKNLFRNLASNKAHVWRMRNRRAMVEPGWMQISKQI
jgi:hypothetical protein